MHSAHRNAPGLGALCLAVTLAAACAGDGDPTGDGGDADTFEPVQDTEVSGTLDVERGVIPAGVTVTVTGDLRLNVAGDMDLAGTLAGECVDIVIAAAGEARITGTVRNRCPEGAEEAGRLVMASEGAMTVEGALIVNSGDVILTDRPDRSIEEVFDTAGATAAAVSVGPPALAAAVPLLPWLTTLVAQADDGSPLTVMNTTIEDTDPANVFSSSVGFIRAGPIFVDGGNRLVAHPGRPAESEVVTGPEDVTARGFTADPGGLVGFKAPMITVREIHGPNVFIAGDGGPGGEAIAVAEAAPGPQAPSATALGGKGGPAGCVVFNTYIDREDDPARKVVLSGGRYQAGKAGPGGAASARGADGQPAQAGGDATATAGAGGETELIPLIFCDRHPVVFGPLEIDPLNPPTVIPAAHGDGGLADAHAGRGGDGIPSAPDGAPGGAVVSVGGATSDFRAFNGLDRDFPREELSPERGVPGDAIGRGGNGGDGISGSCPDTPGGSGGRGGDIEARGGTAPDAVESGGGGGTDAVSPGEVRLEVVANGGDGADGVGGGAAGLPGTDAAQTERRVVTEPSFERGRAGATLACGTPFDPTGTFRGILGAIGGFLDHNPHIHDTPEAGSEVELEVSAGSIVVTGPAPMPTLEGPDLTAPGEFAATGSGTVAGIADVRVDIAGTISAGGEMVAEITYGAEGRLPGGEPIVYRFEGVRQ